MKRAITLVVAFALGIGVGFVARGGLDRPRAEFAPTRIPTSAVVNVTPIPKRILKQGPPFDEIGAA
jgi:hypothetical protein